MYDVSKNKRACRLASNMQIGKLCLDARSLYTKIVGTRSLRWERVVDRIRVVPFFVVQCSKFNAFLRFSCALWKMYVDLTKFLLAYLARVGSTGS